MAGRLREDLLVVPEPRLALLPVALEGGVGRQLGGLAAGLGEVGGGAQAGEVRRGARVVAVRQEEVAGGLGLAGPRQRLFPQLVDDRRVLGPRAGLHRLDLHPAEGAGGELLGRPLVGAVEDLDAMDDAGLLEPGLEVHHLVVVEVLVPDRAEEDEGVPLARRLAEGEAGAGADDAGDRAGDGPGQGAAGADGAGEAGGVDPPVVDRQAAVGVGPHRPHGRRRSVPPGRRSGSCWSWR